MNALAEKITAAYEAEKSTNIKVTEPSQVPPTYEALTNEWLTKVLCKGVSGAAVARFLFDARDDGSSNRRRIFLEYNGAGRAANLPVSVFCKAAENLHNRLVLGLSGTAQGEADFYNLVRERLSIEAPRAHYAGFDPENCAYFIMMHDLGAGAKFPTDKYVLSLDEARGMVDTLSGLHSRFYQSPELGGPTLPFRTWTQWWRDMMRATPTFMPRCDDAFGDAEAFIPARMFRRRLEIAPGVDKSIARHEQLPHSLIHCDVHIKNWYIAANGAMGLHDWQIVSRGHWSRDFVYAICAALTVEQRRDWFDDLLRLYLEKMAAKGATGISFDEGFLNCRQQLVTALAFWLITYRPTAEMPDMQPEDTTLEIIRRLAAAMDDMDSLDSFN